MKWRKSGKRIAPSCWVRSQGVMNGRLALSCSTEIAKSWSELMVGRRRTAGLFMCRPCAWRAPAKRGPSQPGRYRVSHVHLDLVAVQLHQVAARLRFALAHQLG